MAVIYSEKRTSGPLFNFLEFGLYDIEYDAHTVLIVITHHALMCVCCVSDDNPVLFGGEFGRIVLLFKLLNLFSFELHVFTALVKSHFHSSVVNDLSITIN